MCDSLKDDIESVIRRVGGQISPVQDFIAKYILLVSWLCVSWKWRKVKRPNVHYSFFDDPHDAEHCR